jgi:tetratricopeptide (TPR) repeat protein
MLLAALLVAQAGSQLFADANAAYLSGDLPRAIVSYEALVAEGITSPELETNLGAAYLRQGRRGPAALHFERALFLDSSDDDARADLVEVRRGNVDRLEGESEEGGTETLARVLAPLPGATAAVLFVALWLAAWVLLGVRIFWPEKPNVGLAAGACFLLAAFAAATTYASAVGRRLALQRAVVVAQAVPAREGPGEKSASHFEVHEGTTVRVEDEEGQFRRVKLANGLTGWVPSAAVELVVPPGWAGRPVMRAQQP